MKNRKLKKGFTLVELVVVIAIIAILSTVSVVGYLGFTKKANVSGDKALVSQLNTILKTKESETGAKPATATEAIEIVAEQGINVDRLKPLTSKYTIAWNSEANEFALLDENEKVVSGTLSKTEHLNWLITSSDSVVENTTYSTYLMAGYNGKSNLSVKTGLDVGENTNVTSVTYTKTDEAKDVILRTNGGTLTVNADTDNVTHYGEAEKVAVEAVASHSYHEYGEVNEIELTAGHVVVETGSVDTIRVVATSIENVSLEVKEEAKVNAIAATDETVASNLTSVVTVPASSNTSVITTKVGHLPPFAVSGLGTKELPYIWNGTGVNGEKLSGYNADGSYKKNDVLAYWVSRYADAMDLYIKLGSDVYGTSTSNYIFQVQKSGNLHFDLNGHTMNVTTQKAVFYVYGSDANKTANLTIEDSVGTGKVIYNGLSTGSLGVSLVRAYSASKANATAKVTINGGTFETASTKSVYASPVVLAYGTKDKKNVSGIVDITINKGSFLSSVCADGSGNSTVLMASDNEESKITINDGYFETAGSFANRQYVLNAQDNYAGSIIVNGGTYKNYIPGQTNTGSADKIIVNGEVVDNNDYTWTVKKA